MANMEKYILTVQKFDMVCRTCLGFFQPPYQCYTVADTVTISKTVGDLLKEHADVQVEENDELPQNVCTDCYDNLHKMTKFLRRIRHADSKLHNILEEFHRGEMEDEVKPELGLDDGVEGQPPQPVGQGGGEIALVSQSGEEVIKIKVEQGNFLQQMADGAEFIVDQIYETESIGDHDMVEDMQAVEGEMDAENGLMDEDIGECVEETIFICTICSEGFTDNKELEMHLRSHIIKPSEERIREADQLMMEVLSGQLLEGGVVGGEGGGVGGAQGDLAGRTCKECGRVFASAVGLQVHAPTHQLNGGGRRRRRRRRTGPDGGGGGGVEGEGEDNGRVCNKCNKVFATRLGLHSHMIRHQEKQLSCDKCGYKFHTKAGLEIHYRSHSGEKPYKCTYCEKAFSQQGSLTLHTLVHTGERPHKCHLCPAAFKQGHHLAYHLQSHSGEKPFVCTICEKGFASKRNLIIHSRSHTGEKEYICPICQKGFYDRHGVNKHIKRHVFGNTKARPMSDNEPILIGDQYTTLDKLLFKGQR